MNIEISTVEDTLEDKLAMISPLLEQLLKHPSLQQKLTIVNQLPHVQAFLDKTPTLRSFLQDLSPECDYVLKAILAIGQGPIVFNAIEQINNKFERLRSLMHTLLEMEHFYSPIGGIVGYYHEALRLMICCANEPPQKQQEMYHYPPVRDLTKDTSLTQSMIKAGITAMPKLAEVYPIGGAGDRLNLLCQETQKPLPVAQLQFEGMYLLERLVRDLQAREYLYWKLFSVALETPVVFMGSHEKDNVEQTLSICQELRWFGRSPENFIQLVQPLVPLITEKGNFSLAEYLKCTLKPCGHGVIWKLMHDEGVFDWLTSKRRTKVLVRQINNPVSGSDDTLLAFTGIGYEEKKLFGFVGCERLIGSAEGMLVLKQVVQSDLSQPVNDNKSDKDLHAFGITNVEYTNFKSKGIEELPKTPGNCYSQYPANTNILFADLATIKKVVKINPLPGLLINMKSKTPSIDEHGELININCGRLESSMQNIADSIMHDSHSDIEKLDPKALPTYVLYTQRNKALSVTKNAYTPGCPLAETPEGCYLAETPEGCYLDVLANARELLTSHCKMQLPIIEKTTKDTAIQPSYIIKYAAVLGPLYSVIGQKIQGGRLKAGSELQLELSELRLENLDLDGSLRITATQPFGTTNSTTGRIAYSNESGKCELINVTVINAGIDYSAEDNCYWKGEIKRHASFEIIIHGNGEFFADSVVFEGAQKIEVPSGYRIEARMKNGKIDYTTLRIDQPTWFWLYTFASDDTIKLERS